MNGLVLGILLFSSLAEAVYRPDEVDCVTALEISMLPEHDQERNQIFIEAMALRLEQVIHTHLPERTYERTAAMRLLSRVIFDPSVKGVGTQYRTIVRLTSDEIIPFLEGWEDHGSFFLAWKAHGFPQAPREIATLWKNAPYRNKLAKEFLMEWIGGHLGEQEPFFFWKTKVQGENSIGTIHSMAFMFFDESFADPDVEGQDRGEPVFVFISDIGQVFSPSKIH